MAAISVGEIEALLRLRDELTPSLKLASTQMAKTGQDIQRLGSQVQAAGSAMLPFSAAIAGAGFAVVKFGKDFETSMVRIQTLSGEAAADVEKFRKSVLDLAPTVGIGPVALSEALRVITSTGIHGAEALDILKASAKSSAVGMGDTKDIARALTAAIAAYGKENLTAATAAEVLFKTVREGGAEADEVAGALGRVVGITAQVGVSFQEVGGFIATFTRLGVNADEAVTALRGVMTTVLKPTEEAKKALGEMGTSVDELRKSIKEKGLTAALIELVDSAHGNADALAAVVPNVRALAGILGTAGSQAEAMTEIQRRLSEASDDLGAAFLRTGDTLEFKFNVQLAKMETIAVKAFDVFRETFQHAAVAIDPLINAVGAAVDAMAKWPESAKLVALGIAAILAVAGPLVVALGSMIRLVGFSIEGFAMLGSALSTATKAFAATTVATDAAAAATVASTAKVEASAAAAAVELGSLSVAQRLLAADAFLTAKGLEGLAAVQALVGESSAGLAAAMLLASLQAKAEAVAATVASAANGVFAAAMNTVGGSAAFAGASLAAEAAAARLSGIASGAAAIGVQALGAAFLALKFVVLPLIVLWASYKSAATALDWVGWTDMVARFTLRLQGLSDAQAAAAVAAHNSAREQAASATAMDEAATKTKIAADQLSELKDRLSGAAAARDIDRVTQAVRELGDAGALTPGAMRKLADELQNMERAGTALPDWAKRVVEAYGDMADKAGGAGKATASMSQQLAAAQQEMAKFSAAQRTNIKAGDAMRLSVDDIVKSLAVTSPSLKASAGAVQLFVDQLHAGSKAATQAAKDFAEISGATAEKDATDLAKKLGSGQLQLAKLTEESQRKVADVLIEGGKSWTAAGETVSASVQEQITAVGKLRVIPDILKQARAFGADEQARISKESAQKVADAQKVVNDRILENIKAADVAYKASYALRDQLEGASLQRTLARIKDEFDERRNALNKNNAFYKDAIDAIGEEERLTAAKATREWMFGQAETRDQLKQTADHAREQFENIRNSNQFTTEEVQAAWERWYEADRRARGTWAGDWMDALGGIVDAFQQLAQIGDGALSSIVRDIGVFLASLKLAATSADGLKKGIAKIGDGQTLSGLADVASGILGIASAFMQATEHGSTFAKTLKGAALGAKVGGQIAGPTGAIVGAGVGAIAGFLRGKLGVSDAEKEGRAAAADFREGLKKGLSEAQQEELRANIKIGADPNQTATVIAIRDAYKALGRNASEADDVVRRLWEAEKQGGKAVQKVIDEVNDAFREQAQLAADAKEFADTLPGVLDAVAKSGDLVSAKFQDIIDKMKETGQFTSELRDFVSGQAAVGAGGATGFLKVGADAIDALKKKEEELGDLRKQLHDADADSQDDIRQKIAKVTQEIETQQKVLKVAGISSQQSAEALGATLFGAFAEMQRQGKSVTESLAAVAPGVLAMQAQLERTGFSGGAAFDELRRLVALTSDEIGGPAVEAILSLNQALVGLHNAGILDQKTFGGLSKQVTDTFNELVKQGKDGDAALKVIQPTLQTIWELQQDFGFAVDDTTQSLLDQAKTAGIVGDKHRSVNDQIAKGIDRLVTLMEAFVKSLGIDVPTAADQAKKAVSIFNDELLGSVDAAGNIVDALSGIPTDLTVRVNYDVGDVPNLDRTAQQGGGARGQEPTSRVLQAHNDAVQAAVDRGYSRDEIDKFLQDNTGDYGRLADVFRHQGGMVWKRAHQGWMVGTRMAHDEVPIIAQAGEGVLSRRGMDAVGGPVALASLNGGTARQGGSTFNMVAQITVNGAGKNSEELARELAPALVTEFRRNYGGTRSEMETMFEKKKAS